VIVDTRTRQNVLPVNQIIREMRQNWQLPEEILRVLEEENEHEREILRRLEEPREILRRLEERIEHEGDGFLRRLLTGRGMVLNRASVETFILCDVLVSKITADFANQDAAESPRWRERRRSLIEFEFPKMVKDTLRAAKSPNELSEALRSIAETALQLSRLTPPPEVLPGMRSDLNGSRVLRAFVERLIADLPDARYADIAVLAQVVFDRADIHVENIKKLRVPTTRRGRKPSARAVTS
jgi:hypothetical protein